MRRLIFLSLFFASAYAQESKFTGAEHQFKADFPCFNNDTPCVFSLQRMRKDADTSTSVWLLKLQTPAALIAVPHLLVSVNAKRVKDGTAPKHLRFDYDYRLKHDDCFYYETIELSDASSNTVTFSIYGSDIEQNLFAREFSWYRSTLDFKTADISNIYASLTVSDLANPDDDAKVAADVLSLQQHYKKYLERTMSTGVTSSHYADKLSETNIRALATYSSRLRGAYLNRGTFKKEGLGKRETVRVFLNSGLAAFDDETIHDFAEFKLYIMARSGVFISAEAVPSNIQDRAYLKGNGFSWARGGTLASTMLIKGVNIADHTMFAEDGFVYRVKFFKN